MDENLLESENHNIDLNLFQENINNFYSTLNEDIDLQMKVSPLIFYHNFENYKYYNIGKKVIAPKYLLYQLSKYENLEYPIHISINNTLFTILDFIEDIDCIYIPTEKFYNMFMEENESTSIKIIKIIPEKASFLKLKPCSEKFYSLQNIKSYLEIHFKKLYPILEKNEIIKLPYGNEIIEIIITDCKPSNIVSINEIEELEIDFEPLLEKEKEIVKKIENIVITSNSRPKLNFSNNKATKNKVINQEDKDKDKDTKFVPFSGKGRRLGD